MGETVRSCWTPKTFKLKAAIRDYSTQLGCPMNFQIRDLPGRTHFTDVFQEQAPRIFENRAPRGVGWCINLTEHAQSVCVCVFCSRRFAVSLQRSNRPRELGCCRHERRLCSLKLTKRFIRSFQFRRDDESEMFCDAAPIGNRTSNEKPAYTPYYQNHHVCRRSRLPVISIIRLYENHVYGNHRLVATSS